MNDTFQQKAENLAKYVNSASLPKKMIHVNRSDNIVADLLAQPMGDQICIYNKKLATEQAIVKKLKQILKR